MPRTIIAQLARRDYARNRYGDKVASTRETLQAGLKRLEDNDRPQFLWGYGGFDDFKTISERSLRANEDKRHYRWSKQYSQTLTDWRLSQEARALSGWDQWVFHCRRCGQPYMEFYIESAEYLDGHSARMRLCPLCLHAWGLELQRRKRVQDIESSVIQRLHDHAIRVDACTKENLSWPSFLRRVLEVSQRCKTVYEKTRSGAVTRRNEWVNDYDYNAEQSGALHARVLRDLAETTIERMTEQDMIEMANFLAAELNNEIKNATKKTTTKKRYDTRRDEAAEFYDFIVQSLTSRDERCANGEDEPESGPRLRSSSQRSNPSLRDGAGRKSATEPEPD